MIRSASTNFSDIITIGERIDFRVKNERIIDFASELRKMTTPKKNEGQMHELSSTQRTTTYISSSIAGESNYSPNHQNGGQNQFVQSNQRNARNNWMQTHFDPIPMSYTNFFHIC